VQKKLAGTLYCFSTFCSFSVDPGIGPSSKVRYKHGTLPGMLQTTSGMIRNAVFGIL